MELQQRGNPYEEKKDGNDGYYPEPDEGTNAPAPRAPPSPPPPTYTPPPQAEPTPATLAPPSYDALVKSKVSLELHHNRKRAVPLSMTKEDLAEADETFPTVRASHFVTSGKWYYEVQLGQKDVPLMQLGWLLDGGFSAVKGMGMGVGDCDSSWGFDAERGAVWHCSKQALPLELDHHWAPGDVVGFMIDLDSEERSLVFILKQPYGTREFRFPITVDPGAPFVPAGTINIKEDANVRFIFDESAFVLGLPYGFKAIGDVPDSNKCGTSGWKKEAVAVGVGAGVGVGVGSTAALTSATSQASTSPPRPPREERFTCNVDPEKRTGRTKVLCEEGKDTAAMLSFLCLPVYFMVFTPIAFCFSFLVPLATCLGGLARCPQTYQAMCTTRMWGVCMKICTMVLFAPVTAAVLLLSSGLALLLMPLAILYDAVCYGPDYACWSLLNIPRVFLNMAWETDQDMREWRKEMGDQSDPNHPFFELWIVKFFLALAIGVHCGMPVLGALFGCIGTGHCPLVCKDVCLAGIEESKKEIDKAKGCMDTGTCMIFQGCFQLLMPFVSVLVALGSIVDQCCLGAMAGICGAMDVYSGTGDHRSYLDPFNHCPNCIWIVRNWFSIAQSKGIKYKKDNYVSQSGTENVDCTLCDHADCADCGGNCGGGCGGDCGGGGGGGDCC